MPKYKPNMLNPYLINQYSNDPIDLWYWRSAIKTDNMNNEAMNRERPNGFWGIVLSGYRTEQNTGTGNDFDDATRVTAPNNKEYLEITIYPWKTPSLFGSMIPDILTFATDTPAKRLTKLKELMNICTHLCRIRSSTDMSQQSPLEFGCKVWCRFENNTDKTSFNNVRFDFPRGNIEREPEFDKLFGITDKTPAAKLFEEARPQTLSQALLFGEPDAGIAWWAGQYDSSTSIPWKARSDSFIATLHPEFVPYIKAFIYKAYEEKKISIYINAGYRSPKRSNELLAAWVAAGSTGIKPAAGGTSYHNAGMSIDFNPVLSSGEWIKSVRPKKDWVDSGIVEIGESINLRWGGHFGGNYDPVHFDFGKVVSKTVMRQMLATATAQNVEPTAVPSGVAPPTTPAQSNVDYTALVTGAPSTTQTQSSVDPVAPAWERFK